MNNDILWIIEDDVRVRKQTVHHLVGGKACGFCSIYLVASLDNTRFSCLSFNKEGDRLLFNGEDIETNEFFSYLGLIEQVDDSPAYDVIFKGECEVWEYHPWDNMWKRL